MKPWPYPLWIAHRGAGKHAPENTLAAMRVGAHHGFAAFECDVKLSSDCVPILLHDATLDRTTSGRGVADVLSWHELSQLDAGSWHSPEYAGEPIPCLATVAAFCRRNAFALNIEIKPTPGVEAMTGDVTASLAARLWESAETPPLLSSFSPEAIRSARAASPHLPLAMLYEQLPLNWPEQCKELDCRAVIINEALVDAALIGRAHQEGLRMLVYTVNDPRRAARLIEWGVDGVITDAVDRMSPIALR